MSQISLKRYKKHSDSKLKFACLIVSFKTGFKPQFLYASRGSLDFLKIYRPYLYRFQTKFCFSSSELAGFPFLISLKRLIIQIFSSLRLLGAKQSVCHFIVIEKILKVFREKSLSVPLSCTEKNSFVLSNLYLQFIRFDVEQRHGRTNSC